MTQESPTAFAAEIDVPLVRRLVASQFPAWADLAIRPAAPQGWDNRTFRLGETMAVRLPSAAHYATQVEKEQRWLPWLAPQLPLPIPTPLAMGGPGEGYPWPWSVYRWLEGAPAAAGQIGDLTALATAVGAFLAALQGLDAREGPLAGPHCFWRGGPVSTYDVETRQAIAALGARIDGPAATEVWETALGARWEGPPVWFHGDVAVNNLLLADGALSAVIDFGCCGVGDPACDLVLAWTLFEGASRAAFRAALPLDEGAWARGRGWALWKALIIAARRSGSNPHGQPAAHRVIDAVLSDHRGARTLARRSS